MNSKGVQTEQSVNIRRSVNFGYLILPSNGDRDSLVDKCLRTRRFSVMLEKGGGVLHECLAVESAINNFIFPKHLGSIGSPVVIFQEPVSGKGIIVGVANPQDSRKLYTDNQYVIERISDNAYAAIIVDGRGAINIDVVGMVDSSPKLNINVVNPYKDCEVNIRVNGNINIELEGDVNVNSTSGDVNIKGRNINLDPHRLNVGEAEEPMVLGDTLKAELEKTNKVVEKIKDSLLNWSVVSSDGGAALKVYATAALTSLELGDFNKINSEKSFLD